MSNRIYKVNELIKEEIGQILLKELDQSNSIITVTAVETTSDLHQTTVWVSYIGEGDIHFLDKLEDKKGLVQKILNKRLHLKYVPKITFKIDQSGEFTNKLETVFRKINHDNG
jgi:ribosome-binding factor A